ncbi:MAG TPA: ABC transporter substrate-binding protein [Kaistia sp.]|nr:ABC transporter substrate-binding protein [Kaistia sp.]
MKLRKIAFSLAMLASISAPALAADLKIGIGEDPDALDPDQSRTFVGEVVFAAMCDKLVNIQPDLTIIPQLATDWSWAPDGKTLTMHLREGVTFQDGTPFDAAAVVANIQRSQTLPESSRKSELSSVESVTANGDHEVAFHLKNADATLLATLAARSGAMKSPTAFGKGTAADFANHPVCVGPYTFDSRVAQDRIVLKKDPKYWDAQNFHFDTITYLPIPDQTVRLANLRAGDLDMIERVAPTDLKSVQADASLANAQAAGLGYNAITFNVANGAGAKDSPMTNPLLREAFSLSLDREAIAQVVFEGMATPGNQSAPPNSPWFDKADPVPTRDIAKAKDLLKQAGVSSVDFTLSVINDPISGQIAQVIQSMAAEAGFNVTIKASEFGTLLSAQASGDYQADLIGWSGYVDPDANWYQFVVCNGSLNDAKYCNADVDKLMNAARASTDPAVRKQNYDAARTILSKESPIVYLYHPTWIWATKKSVTGFVPYPDGLIRLGGVAKS